MFELLKAIFGAETNLCARIEFTTGGRALYPLRKDWT